MNPLFNPLEFQWKDLDGKTLEFVVNSSYNSLYKEEATVVLGFCKENGKHYVIHTETKRI